jgi:AcrR family transcriptional regulator
VAPPRKHETDVILDAARGLVLADGPRAASVAAIAESSGAPAGTLYHRFGNRDGILTATWLRALSRFQARVTAASAPRAAPDPQGAALDTAVAMAVATVRFARELPEDARILLTIRPGDLLDGEPNTAFRETVAEMNAPLIELVADLARKLYGRSTSRNVDAVSRAVVDLPYTVVRRHAYDQRIPAWLESDIASSARALLTAHQADTGS